MMTRLRLVDNLALYVRVNGAEASQADWGHINALAETLISDQAK